MYIFIKVHQLQSRIKDKIEFLSCDNIVKETVQKLLGKH